MKAIILARESDKNQDSNDAQLSRITEYVRNKNLEEWKVFKIKESSTKGYRRKFQEIIEIIKQSKETLAVVVDTVDRLQRSFKESVVFDELRKEGKVEIHFYRENLVIHRNSNSSDILRWDMGVMFSKSYVLQLSDNLKRKQNKMREDGEITNGPPIGYSSVYNDNPLRRRRIDVVPNEKAHFIVNIFEEYAKAGISVETLADKMFNLGLRSDAGLKIQSDRIYKILNDTFYYGVAYSRTHKMHYPHKYKPIVTKDIYDKCQEVMNRHSKVPAKYRAKPFIFRAIVTCHTCGCVVGGEIKKGKYVYYSCSGVKGCKRTYTPEKVLIDQVYNLFDTFNLTDKQINDITEMLKEIGNGESLFNKQSASSLKAEYDKYQIRIKKMYEDRLDGRLGEKEYDELVREYKAKQSDVLEQMKGHTDADENFHLTANMLLSICKRAKEIFKSSEIEEKRQILNFLLQNSTLSGEKLYFTMRSPFSILFNQGDTFTMRKWCNLLRTVNWKQAKFDLSLAPSVLSTNS